MLVRDLVRLLDDYINAPSSGPNPEPRFDAATNDALSNSSGVDEADVCCVLCRLDHSTDENDVLMCDGKGCFRGYHMQCISPAVSVEEVEGWGDTEPWMCPYCDARGEALYMINDVYFCNVDEEGARSPRSPSGVTTYESSRDQEVRARAKRARAKRAHLARCVRTYGHVSLACGHISLASTCPVNPMCASPTWTRTNVDARTSYLLALALFRLKHADQNTLPFVRADF